jgi:hypothetical protein
MTATGSHTQDKRYSNADEALRDVVRDGQTLAVAVGSIAGMMVNFFTARQFVFR